MVRLLIIAVAGCLSYVGDAQACSCEVSPVIEMYKLADVVFVGKFLRLNEVTFNKYFQVSQQLKGFPPEKVGIVELGPENSQCFSTFDVDREYLIFVLYQETPPLFYTGICMGNKRLGRAIRDLKEIAQFRLAIQPERFDIDKNGIVDITDYFMLADHWDTFDPNGDGIRNIEDVFILADAFGWRSPRRLITAYNP